MRGSVLALLVVLAGGLPACGQTDHVGVYLTWQRDPSTTITVNWVNLYAGLSANVWYRPMGADPWQKAVGRQHAAGPSALQVRRVELTGLVPDRLYEFFVGASTAPRDAKGAMRFRTMPAELSRPIRFVAGGDMMHSREMVDAMNRQAGALDPDFALLGGDLAYADGVNASRWIDWLQSWTKHVRGKGGRLVPMVVAIGNHEVRGGYRGRVPVDAPYFYSLFALPGGRAYYALDFGKYLSFVVLDSGHTNPVTGAQEKWLAGAMRQRAEQRFLFPVYHYPAYGTAKSARDQLPCETARAVEIRQQWIPHFERHGVTAVFEHDHHNYKRTHPILGHERDDARGIVYLGDGAWGVKTRTVPKDAWYLAKAEPRRHLFHVTLQPAGTLEVEAMDAAGVVFDRVKFERSRTAPVESH